MVVRTDHQRSDPDEGLAWRIEADLPADAANLSWSLSGSGMSIQGWAWEGDGAISVSGDTVAISGSPGTRASG